jgi:hypothetical protein
MCVICVLCLIVAPLPRGENPFAVIINNNNNNNRLEQEGSISGMQEASGHMLSESWFVYSLSLNFPSQNVNPILLFKTWQILMRIFFCQITKYFV